MSAYFVANYKITNKEGYDTYVPPAVGTILACGAEVLVADSESEVMEGSPDNVTIILKFASKEVAKTWYNSPGYQKILPARLDNTEGFAVLTNQFVMPG